MESLTVEHSLSECYGSYASSAIAAQSFLRNMFAGAFSFFTEQVSLLFSYLPGYILRRKLMSEVDV